MFSHTGHIITLFGNSFMEWLVMALAKFIQLLIRVGVVSWGQPCKWNPLNTIYEGGGGLFSQTLDGRGDLAKIQDSVLPTLYFQFWGTLYSVMNFSIMSVVQMYTLLSSRSSLLTLSSHKPNTNWKKGRCTYLMLRFEQVAPSYKVISLLTSSRLFSLTPRIWMGAVGRDHLLWTHPR